MNEQSNFKYILISLRNSYSFADSSRTSGNRIRRCTSCYSRNNAKDPVNSGKNKSKIYGLTKSTDISQNIIDDIFNLEREIANLKTSGNKNESDVRVKIKKLSELKKLQDIIISSQQN